MEINGWYLLGATVSVALIVFLITTEKNDDDWIL